MKYGKYEIKKVSHMKSMSEETECFSLELYVDGKKLAHVGNDGHGGCHRVVPLGNHTWDDIKKVEEEMAKDEFLVTSEFEKFDSAVSTLLELHLTEKDIKRYVKTKVAFLLDGQISVIGYKNSKEAPDDALYAHVEKKYPGVTILNKMDLSEAAIEAVKANNKRISEMFALPPSSKM